MNPNPRDTGTGRVHEQLIIPALESAGYTYEGPGVNIGCRPGGRQHRIDFLVEGHILISMKWQQVSGTAEQKIPFEVISLVHAIQSDMRFDKAYLVMGGEGWSLREFFCNQGLDPFIRGASTVQIITLELFIALINRRAL